MAERVATLYPGSSLSQEREEPRYEVEWVGVFSSFSLTVSTFRENWVNERDST